MRRTGYPLGLGPIQAAQVELGGAVDARNYSSAWFSTTDIPTGYLNSDQHLTPEEAARYKAMWRGDGDKISAHEMKVLGAGLEYKPLLLKPADVQFLETRQFNRTGVATLLGIPASLLNAPVQGNSRTYNNAEDEYITFNRFTLMLYLRPIEIALSALVPAGRKSRFNIEALRRTSTKDRYESYKVGIDAGFLTVPEIRAREGLRQITPQEASNVDT
jgi:HK97 family phage portal protein